MFGFVLCPAFNPSFYQCIFVDHFVKDLSIAIEEAEKIGLRLPGLSNAKKAYEYLKAMGHGGSGTQSLILALAKQNAVEWNG